MKVRGVGRDTTDDRFVFIALSDRPTDDQLRSLHEHLRAWQAARTPAAAVGGWMLKTGSVDFVNDARLDVPWLLAIISRLTSKEPRHG